MKDEILSNLTVVIPAKNEAPNLPTHLEELRTLLPTVPIIVVDDGSEDNTASIARAHGAQVISHPYSMGNGAAIKSGARTVDTTYVLFLDADGQHNPADIPRLVEKAGEGYRMVIGARTLNSHASVPRRLMNQVYNKIASAMTGHQIEDLTSGFRLVESKYFKQFIYLLPNGFSYPTTITMAFLRSGLPIKYVTVEARQRDGKSKIRPLKDGFKFLIIIMKIGALFSPMRLFLPTSLALFSTGILYYLYTFVTENRFTNMGAVLILSSIFVFLIGILSEQVSSLHYQVSQADDREKGE